MRAHGLDGALDDDVHDLHRVESGRQPPRHLEEGAGLALAALGLGEQPRVPNRLSRLIGEGLGNPDLLVGEYPPHTVAQHQHTDHVFLHEQRQRHHRPERRALHSRPLLRRLQYPRIVEQVRGDDGLAILRGHSGGPEPDPVHDGRAGCLPVIALERQRHELVGIRSRFEQSGVGHPEKGQHAFRDAFGHLRDVQRLGDEPSHRGQPFRGEPTSFGLLKEPLAFSGVVERRSVAATNDLVPSAGGGGWTEIARAAVTQHRARKCR